MATKRTGVAVGVAAAVVLCGATIATWRWAVSGARTEPRRIVASVSLPGMTVADVDRDVASLLEGAARSVRGTQRVRVVSREGDVKLELTLAPGAKPDVAWQSLSDALRPVAWPTGALAPTVVHAPMHAGLRFVLTSDSFSMRELRALLDAKIAPVLERTSGVASVVTCGPTYAAVVRVDAFRAKGHGVDAARLVDALTASGPAFADDRAVSDVRIAEVAGVPVRVRDVAELAIEMRADGCDAFARDRGVFSGMAHVQAGADPTRTIADARAALARIELPPGVRLAAFDGGREIVRARVRLAVPSREQAAPIAQKIAAQLATTQDVVDVLVERGGEATADEDLTVYVAVVEPAKRAVRSLEDVMSLVAKTIRELMPGVALVVDDGTGVARVRVVGDDLESMRHVAEAVRAALETTPGVVGIVDDGRVTPSIEIRPDRDALARYGLNVEAAARIVRLVVRGERVGALAQPNGGAIDVVVRVGPAKAGDARELPSQAFVQSPTQTIPLAQVSSVHATSAPQAIVREDGRRSISLWFALRGDRPRALREAQAAVAANVKLPLDTALAWDDERR